MPADLARNCFANFGVFGRTEWNGYVLYSLCGTDGVKIFRSFHIISNRLDPHCEMSRAIALQASPDIDTIIRFGANLYPAARPGPPRARGIMPADARPAHKSTSRPSAGLRVFSSPILAAVLSSPPRARRQSRRGGRVARLQPGGRCSSIARRASRASRTPAWACRTGSRSARALNCSISSASTRRRSAMAWSLAPRLSREGRRGDSAARRWSSSIV
jgi:hypothetical protein